jgi:ribosomal protein L32
MGKPKKRTSPRRTGTRRSHLVLKLARKVNAKSPVKAFTTTKESAKPAAKVTSKAAPKKVSA